MIEAAAALTTDEVVAVGVGAAGIVDVAHGVLRYAPNLAWRDLPIAERMAAALGCLVSSTTTRTSRRTRSSGPAPGEGIGTSCS